VLLLGGSAATLGLIGFLNTIPNLVFALPAGALADRYDRRKLLLIFQSLNMALAAALAVTWATGTLTIGLVGVLAVLGDILGTLSFAPFQAMLAATVPTRDLESAVAINSLSLQVARFVGPAIAGFLLATAGPTWVFGVNAASFVAVLGTLAFCPVRVLSAALAAALRLQVGRSRHVRPNLRTSQAMGCVKSVRPANQVKEDWIDVEGDDLAGAARGAAWNHLRRDGWRAQRAASPLMEHEKGRLTREPKSESSINGSIPTAR
jgi:MFS family permease